MDRPKVIVVSEGKHGPAATQKISFGQPFAFLDGATDTEIVFEGHIGRPSAIQKTLAGARASLLVLSRYTSYRGLDWIRLARDRGIPTIYHIDDDLLAVPESLGKEKFEAYNSPERLKALRDNMEACDLVYVSTPALAGRFAEHGINAPIVAGDIYCSVSPAEVGPLVPPALGPVIGYMGTGGHSADLAMVLPAICDIMDRVSNLQFELFGTIDMPGELARFGRRVRHLPPVADYAQFTDTLRSLGWWVGLAPLEDNAFNRCKADTKWVEYSMAGFATVASDLPVYHRACSDGAGILARTPEDWGGALERLLCDPALRQAMIGRAQEKLRRDYSHARLRRQVLEVFDTARRHAARTALPTRTATKTATAAAG